MKNIYYNEVRKNYHQLTNEEVIQLITEGNTTKIFNSIAPMVIQIANSFNYTYPTIDLDDLIAEGNVGVLNAIRGYKEDAEATFITYAKQCITNEIKTFIRTKNDIIKKPSSNKRNVEIPITNLIEDYEDYDIPEVIQDDYQPDDHNIFKSASLTHFINKLKPIYQIIIKMRYNEEKTFEEIAEALNTSRQNIHQKHDKAISKLKKEFNTIKKGS